MPRPSATPASPYATGVIAAEVAELAAGAEPPAEIKITPAGAVTTRDGRVYSFDAAALVARFASDGIDLPIDLDHATSRRVLFGERANAVGWIKGLAARPDGIYATQIEWLPEGRAALAARSHRYISPTFHHTEAGAATWLHSVALVTAPALAMPAVADASHHQETAPVLKQIAKALGLAETADEAACLSAIANLNTGKVDKAVHDETLARLSAATTELDGIRKATRDGKVATLIGDALKAKKIVPAQKEQYEALCATDAGLAQVEALLAATPAALHASDLDERPHPDPGDGGTVNPATLAAQATAYRKKMADAGTHMSVADAVIAVQGGAK
jgi:phage I-like protein